MQIWRGFLPRSSVVLPLSGGGTVRKRNRFRFLEGGKAVRGLGLGGLGGGGNRVLRLAEKAKREGSLDGAVSEAWLGRLSGADGRAGGRVAAESQAAVPYRLLGGAPDCARPGGGGFGGFGGWPGLLPVPRLDIK